ncbi:hypothetical protein BEH_11645 [Priestia filamentosa]|uniref:Uncharacterized protein n=1 Tax=Priestia filamentosa TaxID=1402861 RepID=A0A0H4KK79_9BACI|nr:hypothetical protein [Priestia filamentosa]AKO92689.1 hypothetical protein BEH_11645 [Priestia filamentosa]
MSKGSAVFVKVMKGAQTFNKGDVLEDEHGKSKITSINKVEIRPNGFVEVVGWCKRLGGEK